MLKITFEKLFGRFNYEIVFNNEGLTILTGPNGYGKSTILKTIEALGNGIRGLPFFLDLDFVEIDVFFKNSITIVLKKKNGNLILNDITIKPDILSDIDMIRNHKFRSYVKYENSRMIHRFCDMYDADEEVVDYLYNILKNKNAKEKSIDNLKKLRDVLKKTESYIGNICFIKEQRLIREDRNRHDEIEVVNIIEELPKKFKKLMDNVQKKYSDVASELDSTYPNRLFDTKLGITEEEFLTKMEEMRDRFQSLSKYDLLLMQELKNSKFNAEHAKALKVYFDDFDKKYQVYEEFIEKLDLYTQIVNDRLSFKSLKISKELGISIVDDTNKRLELSQLSSGEKQEIVLFYDLIFTGDKKTLLLIDEPEISLHITWQKRFMDDLLKIIKYRGFNVIVATHSPQIISNHWDKQIDLGELYGRELNTRQFI